MEITKELIQEYLNQGDYTITDYDVSNEEIYLYSVYTPGDDKETIGKEVGIGRITIDELNRWYRNKKINCILNES